MTARGIRTRIWWDCHRGCCEAGPPPSMPRCRVSIHENLERILWLRKRRRRKRPRRRRPRSRRRSEFWPGWSCSSSARAPNSGYDFGERRTLGPPFWFLASWMRVSRMSVATSRMMSAALIRATGKFQRSANASLAPSAANPAAKLRRSQAIARGRVMTRSRKEAANRP